MFPSKIAFERSVFTPYATGFGVPEAVRGYWREVFNTSADAALWWTEKWLDAPAAFLAWAPARGAVAKPTAAVIDLARAAAARAAADVADATATVVEIVETIAETPAVVAEDLTSVATVAAETVAEEVLAADDLTCMVGIGPKLSAALAERGITRFAQIAAWTADDLAGIDKALDLKGRAVRDAWISQAKRFSAAN